MKAICRKIPRWVYFLIALMVVTGIGYLDYLTGDYSLLIFYLAPIYLAAWFSGRVAGVVTAIASGFARYFSDYLLMGALLRLWNPLQDTLFLLVVSLLLSLIKQMLDADNGVKSR